jgi:branched-chain amino acid transport system ATP-binding protein
VVGRGGETVRDQPSALEIDGLHSGYVASDVLHGVSLSVAPGSVAAILGPNGAGKSTLLRTISGFLPLRAGSVHLRGVKLSTADPVARAQAGLCAIPEGRGVFGGLTVRENLRLFAPGGRRGGDLARVLDRVPRLNRLLGRTAGTLSGGEQQMLALSRAYLTNPSVITIDEVSLGLAPIVVDEVFEMLTDLRRSGAAMVLVEQYVQRALALADSVCVLNRGRVTFAGSAEQAGSIDLHDHYFRQVGPGDDPAGPVTGEAQSHA